MLKSTIFEHFKFTDTYMICKIIENKDGVRDD